MLSTAILGHPMIFLRSEFEKMELVVIVTYSFDMYRNLQIMYEKFTRVD